MIRGQILASTKSRYLFATILAIIVLAAGAFAFKVGATTPGTTTSTNTCSSSTTTTTSSISSSKTNGSFTYSPSYPVQILSVQAITTPGQNGNRYVTFGVVFENVGNSPIYVVGGCGSGLESSIGAGSSVVQKTSAGPLCACAEFIMPLNHGQNHTSSTPGCWSGYNYRLVQPGSIAVNLTLHWWSGQNLQNSNSLSIVAEFTFT